jgi:predicted Zn-dependent protease
MAGTGYEIQPGQFDAHIMILKSRLTIRGLLAAASACLLFSCATTNLKPMGSLGEPFRLEQDEEKLWQDSRSLEDALDKSGFIYHDAEIENYLNEVLAKLVTQEAKSARASPRVKVVRNLYLNAFALPHGIIYLHTGMLAHMENEDQLATVLGHEQTHFTHRHTLRELRRVQNTEKVVSAFQMLVFVAAAGAGVIDTRLLDRRSGAILTLASVSGYSRELETEADTVGFKLMVDAGYDPIQSLRIFEIFQRESDGEKSNQPFFFSTHPRLQERIENLRELTEKAQASGQSQTPRPKDSERFAKCTQKLLIDHVRMNIEKGRLQVAQSALQKYFRLWPESTEAFFLQGEIYRRSGKGDPHVQLAVDAYRKAIQIDPSNAKAHREIGLFFRELKRNEEASGALQRFLILSPQAPDAPIIQEYIKELTQSQQGGR